MRHQEIKKEIISIFGEEFYNAVISNSDGVSGILYIKENILILDYLPILDNAISSRYIDFKENLMGTNVVESIDSAIRIIETLAELVVEKSPSGSADLLLEKHYSFLQQEFMKKINEKNNSNYSLDQILISDKSKEEFAIKLKNRWHKAHQQNEKDCRKGTFSEFEEKMKVNVVINTLRYF